MRARLRLRGRLLASHLVVVLVGTITLFTTVGLVAPGAFDAAMGHAMGGAMDSMMTDLVQTAFRDAIGNAMVIAVGASVVAAVIASVLLASRVSGPISRLAAASRRIADGRYAERVAVAPGDEIGDLAGSFNRMAESLERFTKTETGDKGQEIEREIPFMKGYTVFNVEQIDGLPSQYQQAPCPAPEPLQFIQQAEAFFKATGARFQHGGNRAFYAPARDFIQLPLAEAFKDPESYAATKAHELIHWTGHESRNAREFGKRFGDDAYAFEELVAELGAAFLCADLGITPEIRDDHAAYVGHWLQVLKQDKRAIFSAASHAQRAADYLQGLQQTREQVDEQAEQQAA